MKHETVRASAFAMPLTNPAFPAGPYRFVNREYFIIQYRTDLEALRRIVPEPLVTGTSISIDGGWTAQ
jgi:acetoacetate decarboxylase